MLDVQMAVAKTNKYASRESGDTAEVVERPHGGFSVVLADGQGSGRAAKNISHLVTTKAISLIKDGARDGAVARSVHDYLYTYKGGKVSATLAIVTLDLSTYSLVLSRNSHCPILLSLPGSSGLRVLEEASNPIGIYAMTKPVITELPLEAPTYAVTFSDGLQEAGRREGRPVDPTALFRRCLDDGITTASGIADYLLARALEADANRPADDMTVLALSIHTAPQPEANRITPQIRRLEMRVPV
jgi:serine phosphatase RsbU (regulator of sigma subunit)